MAQSGKTPILLYHSTVASAVPNNANTQAGELAMNIADMKLYTENSGGTITLLASADAAAGNFTTVDTTNLEVTNIKAKDGTASATIANSTGVMTIGSSVLTTTDINGGTIDGTAIGGSTPAAGAFTTVSATKATSGDVATFTTGTVGSESLYVYVDANTAALFNTAAAGAGRNGIQLNPTNVIVDINATTIGTFSSTGLAVTGALSSTGAFTLLGTPFTAGAGVRYISGGGTAGSFFTNVPTGSNHQWAVNDVAVVGINSTGLSVTGLVSGTGGGFNGTGVMDVISFAGIGLAIGGRFTSSPSSSDYCFIGAQDTGGPGGLSGDLILIPRSSISGQVRIFAGSGTPAQIAAFSSTGLAVTGTGSFTAATGTVSINSTTGTNAAYQSFSNTGGNYFVGVDNSTGATFGGTAYALLNYAPAGKVIQNIIAGTGVITTVSSTGLAVTGGVQTTGGRIAAATLYPITAVGTISTSIGQSTDGLDNPDVDMRRWQGVGTLHGVGRISVSSSGVMTFMTDPSVATNTYATTVRATIDGNGLAVTGALSCSTNLTVTGGTITTGSTTALSLATSGGTVANFLNAVGGVNFINFSGAGTGADVYLQAAGSDTDVGLFIGSKGSDAIYLHTAGSSYTTQVAITHTASANRYITLTGSNGGNPTIGTSAGDLALGSRLKAASGAWTENSNLSTTSGVASTIFTMSGASRGRYEIVALIPNSGAPAQYTAIATAIWDGNGARIVSSNGANLTLTLSGGAVQVTQTAGSTQTVYWSHLYIPLE